MTRLMNGKKSNRVFFIPSVFIGDFQVTIKDVARFESKFIKGDGCWEWQRGVYTNGYGNFAVGGGAKAMAAHRFSYLIYKGKIEKEKFVCHSCDNRLCVNPDHLFIGTHLDNMNDMNNKGRGKRPSNKGENHSGHKLNWKKVDEIRKIGRSMSAPKIALLYGVCARSILDVLTYKTWNEIAREALSLTATKKETK